MIWRNILKERGHKTTYRVKRELVTFALYQQQLPIVVANVDDLEQVDVDYQTLLTNESIFEMPHKLWAIIEKKTGAVKSAYGSCFAG